MSKPRLAVVQFPGSNCEYETQRAAAHYGFQAEIVRWNLSGSEFETYDGYILPGGFSFQDRVRSGAISAKLPLMNTLQQGVRAGKAVLGICNGCQILVEAGIIPDTGQSFSVEAGMGHNHQVSPEGERRALGFLCDWVFVKVRHPEKSIFTRYFSDSDVIPVPVNHGEGRFMLKSEAYFKFLDHHASFVYCDAHGQEKDFFPINPNGAVANLAGLTNTQGNVLAMMPHPERASFVRQIPFWISSTWARKKKTEFLAGFSDGEGPWAKLFISLRESLG